MIEKEEKKTGVKEKEGFKEVERAGWMPDPVDPDDEDADPSVRPEKVEVPEVAFKPIVRFDFDIEAGHVRSARYQEQEGLQRDARPSSRSGPPSRCKRQP